MEWVRDLQRVGKDPVVGRAIGPDMSRTARRIHFFVRNWPRRQNSDSCPRPQPRPYLPGRRTSRFTVCLSQPRSSATSSTERTRRLTPMVAHLAARDVSNARGGPMWRLTRRTTSPHSRGSDTTSGDSAPPQTHRTTERQQIKLAQTYQLLAHARRDSVTTMGAGQFRVARWFRVSPYRAARYSTPLISGPGL